MVAIRRLWHPKGSSPRRRLASHQGGLDRVTPSAEDPVGLGVLDPSFVNEPGFKATLTLDYEQRLNDLNPAPVAVSVVEAETTWSNVEGSYPLFSWVASSMSCLPNTPSAPG